MSNFIVDPYKFALPPYATTTYTNDDANDLGSNHKIYGTGRYVNASKIGSEGVSALVGMKMKEMKCLCQKIGSPASSTIYGRIWDTDNTDMDILETSPTTYDTDSISDSAPYTTLTFDFSGDITLTTDYKVGIYASISGGTSSNSIVLRAYSPRTTDNADLLFVEWNPGEDWNVSSSTNLWQYFSA